jgi:hypothetical protein
MVGLEGCSVKHLAGLFSNMGIKVLELMTASGLVLNVVLHDSVPKQREQIRLALHASRYWKIAS